ncbi:calmodulin-like protein 4 isoform X2 [Balaenoptera musculus]|uniref:Calmodulin-like protein 4 isoform X2 n=1 Tax=Balaenoptera musculus TaxID=9771 RepID=A0A8B8WNT3_BALMU|nr:calmodulin-like protein 4 isoform X2 [Balaenoptera musculus]
MTCQLLGCYLVRSSKGGCRVLFAAHGGVLLQDVASNVSSPHAWSSFDSRRMAGECRQKAKTWMTCQLLGCYLVSLSRGNLSGTWTTMVASPWAVSEKFPSPASLQSLLYSAQPGRVRILQLRFCGSRNGCEQPLSRTHLSLVRELCAVHMCGHTCWS